MIIKVGDTVEVRRGMGSILRDAKIDNIQIKCTDDYDASVMQVDLNKARTIIADRRATAAILKWYFYTEPVNITVYDDDKKPGNHFELKFSYNSEFPSPVIAITTEQIEPSIAGIKWRGFIGTSNHQIARDEYRHYYFYLGRN